MTRLTPNHMKATRTVYTFDELTPEAKEKARAWYRDADSDFPFLEEYLTERATELLVAAGYEVDDLSLVYSLGYSQGDGLSFSATLTRKDTPGLTYNVQRNDSRYTHARTMYVTVSNDDHDSQDDENTTAELRDIAVQLERDGYKHIEYEHSDEHVDDTILVNEYTFTNTGSRLDPD